MDINRRNLRRRRIRARVRGTAERPRVSVYRSNRYVSVQLIDDEQGQTLVAVDGRTVTKSSKVTQAAAVGVQVAEAAKKKGITKLVFDRAGYRYHGRVKALAQALREAGINV